MLIWNVLHTTTGVSVHIDKSKFSKTLLSICNLSYWCNPRDILKVFAKSLCFFACLVVYWGMSFPVTHLIHNAHRSHDHTFSSPVSWVFSASVGSNTIKSMLASEWEECQLWKWHHDLPNLTSVSEWVCLDRDAVWYVFEKVVTGKFVYVVQQHDLWDDSDKNLHLRCIWKFLKQIVSDSHFGLVAN